MGVNGSSFHAQTGQFRLDERGLGLVQIPPRAQFFPLSVGYPSPPTPLGANEVLTGVPKMMPATREAASPCRPSVTWE
jgi:hypothetical protein